MCKLRAFGGFISNAPEILEELGIATDNSKIEIDYLDKMAVLEAYKKWGMEFPKHLNGIFYIIIDDEDNNRTVLARDRFGGRSLYYFVTKDGKLLCDTSIRKIIEMPGFVKEFNPDALELFLSFSYLPGENTFFDGLKKVMPGKVVAFENGEVIEKTYWKPIVKQNENISIDEMGDKIHEALINSKNRWERGAKVKGNFLSGGVDSGYLTALMKPQVTVSASYDDPKFDESPMAKETAEALGVEFGSFKVTKEDYFDAVPKAMYAMEQPLADASTIVFYLCAKEAAKKGDVFYSGEGADELFSGYHAYVRRVKQIEEAKQNGVDLCTLPQVEDYYIGNTRVFHEKDKQEILRDYRGNIIPLDLARSMYKWEGEKDDVVKILLCDLAVWFEGDIMLNAEKMSLAHGLNCRTPFLDNDVVDVALTIPSKYRANTEQTKLAFRTAATNLLPKEIAWRRKIGFAAPTRTWMCEEPYMSSIKATLSGDNAKKFFDVEKVLEMYKEENIEANWRKLWSIYVFLIWYEQYFA